MIEFLLIAVSLGLVAGQTLHPIAAAAGFAGLATLASWRLLSGRWQLAPMVLVLALLCGLSLALGPWPVWVTGSASLAVAACTWLLWRWPVPHLPKPTGAFGVGLRICDVSVLDQNLQLYVWYPAAKSDRARTRPYYTKLEARAFSNGLRAMGLRPWLLDHFKLARTATVESAAPSQGSFPAIYFNHGNALWPTQCFSLMQELASRGYVVVAIGRPERSAGVVAADGSIIPLDMAKMQALLPGPDGLRAQAAYILNQDPACVRDLAQAVGEHTKALSEAVRIGARETIAIANLLGDKPPDSLQPIIKVSALDRRTYMGMSLGGAMAAECCFLDPYAVACVNLDGAILTFDRMDLDVPCAVLQLYADPFTQFNQLRVYAPPDVSAPSALTKDIRMYNDLFYERRAARGARGDVFRLIAKGAAHMAFSDWPLSVRPVLSPALPVGSNDGPKFVSEVNKVCADFLDANLKGQDQKTLRHSIDGSPIFLEQELPPE